MKKMYASICVAISMLLVVSVGSVIGTDHINMNQPTIVESPLFQTQTTRFTGSSEEKIGSSFIGKDALPSSYGFTSQAIDKGFEKALVLLQKHPQILTKILPIICSHEVVEPILQENNIQLSDLQQQIKIFQQNPTMFDDIIKTYGDESNLNNPSTLGMNSSNPIAILIVLFALLPLLVTLVLIIATATIITCLNIGGCFEAIFNAIVYGFINGLKPA